jgi:3,4-dihydroxy-2-butanone 4-phosphate synthase
LFGSTQRFLIFQTDDRENALDLIWFPTSFPKLVRVIVTASPSHCFDVLKKRKCEILELSPLEEGERKSFIRLYLNLRSRLSLELLIPLVIAMFY